MGKIIVIAGNSGVGKTTLTAALCRLRPFATGLEQHDERPFHSLMAADHARYALANQVDFLLLRAEQERALRDGPAIGLIDGGLDLDFHGFTHLFREKGYLTGAEFDLLARLHATLRGLLGPPDVVLYLTAPVEIVRERFAARGRPLEIAQAGDLARMEEYISDWISVACEAPVIPVDAGAADYCSPTSLDALLAQIDAALGVTPGE